MEKCLAYFLSFPPAFGAFASSGPACLWPGQGRLLSHRGSTIPPWQGWPLAPTLTQSSQDKTKGQGEDTAVVGFAGAAVRKQWWLSILQPWCYHVIILCYYSIDFRAPSLLPAIPLIDFSLPFTVHIYLQEIHAGFMGILDLCAMAKLSWQGYWFKVSFGGSATPSGTASGITTSSSAIHPWLLPLCYKEEFIAKSRLAESVNPTVSCSYTVLSSPLESEVC